MRRLLPLAVLACAPTRTPPASGAQLQSVAFAVSNVSERLLMRAALSGRANVYEGSVVVVVFPDSVVSFVAKADPSNGPDSVCAALASGDPNGKWRIDYRSAAQPLRALIRRSDRSVADSARFVINARSAELQSRWLVFEFSSILVDPRSRQRNRAYNYLMVPRDLFTREARAPSLSNDR